MNFFFSVSKIYFWGDLKKKVGYSFDVKLYDLSIYEHFRAIPALQRRFWTQLLFSLLEMKRSIYEMT